MKIRVIRVIRGLLLLSALGYCDEPPYVIQPNDILEIFVWKEPELTRKVLVRPDGRISIPLVQDMQAAGINPTDLKAQLEEKLKEYLPAPNVTIIVDAIQSYRIYVNGKVQKPGSLTSYMLRPAQFYWRWRGLTVNSTILNART